MLMNVFYLAHLFFLVSSQSSFYDDLQTIELKEYSGVEVNIVPNDSLLFLFVYLNPDCPISQKYASKIRLLSEKDMVSLIGVQPNLGVTREKIETFKSEFQFDFPIINDERQLLTSYMGATVTPEVFLVDSQGQVIYQGAIDNWFVALGKYRPAATELFVDDVIAAWAIGSSVQVSKTEAIGCLIQD
jgi:hypothetical protein